MFLLFLLPIFAEIIIFDAPGSKVFNFTLLPENINTGFFNPAADHNMKFSVKIASKDGQRTLYFNDALPEGKETHFSFNNTESDEIVLTISAAVTDPKMPLAPCEFQMKFESTPDTFNNSVSKEVQYKPAISALNHLLVKLNDITAQTKDVYNKLGDLKAEQKKTVSFVLGFSIFSLIAFTGLNFFKLYMMKTYLNKKKYL